MILTGIIVVCSVILGVWVLARFVSLEEVQESHAAVFNFLGKYACTFIQLTNHHLDRNGVIVDGDGPNSVGCWRYVLRVGGWVFYLRPFVKTATYSDYNSDKDFGEGGRIKLNDVTPEPVLSKAETSEGLPLNLEFVVTMYVVCPYLFLFKAPRDVAKQVLNRIEAALRAWVRSCTDEDVQQAKGNGKLLWDKLCHAVNCQDIFDNIEAEWGIHIKENSIIVKDVGYDEDYQDALKAEKQGRLRARGDVEETAGRILLSTARMAGVDIDDPAQLDEFRTRIHQNPSLLAKPVAEGGLKEHYDFAVDQVKRDRSGVYDIRVAASDGSSLKGNLEDFAVFAALLGALGKGGVGAGKSGGRKDAGGGKRNKQKPWERSDEERKASWEARKRRNEGGD